MKRITTLVLAGAALMSLSACAAQKVEYAKFNEQAVAAKNKEQSGGPTAVTFTGKGKAAATILGVDASVDMTCKLVYAKSDNGWDLNKEKSSYKSEWVLTEVFGAAFVTADAVQEDDKTTYYVSPLQTKTESTTITFTKYGRLAKKSVKSGETDYSFSASWSY